MIHDQPGIGHRIMVERARWLALARIPADPPGDHRHSVAEIISTIARLHHSKPAEMTSRSRYVYIMRARYHAIHMLHRLRPEFSGAQIGRHIGRNRSTVEHALRVFDSRVRPHIGEKIRDADELLQPAPSEGSPQ